MGPKGEISRILAPLYGSYLTFASLASGKESAPGQITATTLRDIYRIKDIRPGLDIYGLIGNPVSKAKSVVVTPEGCKEAKELFEKHFAYSGESVHVFRRKASSCSEDNRPGVPKETVQAYRSIATLEFLIFQSPYLLSRLKAAFSWNLP